MAWKNWISARLKKKKLLCQNIGSEGLMCELDTHGTKQACESIVSSKNLIYEVNYAAGATRCLLTKLFFGRKLINILDNSNLLKVYKKMSNPKPKKINLPQSGFYFVNKYYKKQYLPNFYTNFFFFDLHVLKITKQQHFKASIKPEFVFVIFFLKQHFYYLV